MDPSSSISIEAPLSSVIDLIVDPPLPITSLTFSGSTFMVTMAGAFSETSALDLPITLFISSRIWSLASLAWSKAVSIISSVIPWILISIWRAVTPASVPATLKSISPRWSSSPKISVKTAKPLSSRTKPIATPATGALRGTPASINDKLAPQTLAIEEEPFDSVISETTLVVYGHSSVAGSTAVMPRRASRPWPISLRLGPPEKPVSPTL